MAWYPRFVLAKQITPADVQQFEPVTEAHYNPGRGLMALSMLLRKLSGLKIDRITKVEPVFKFALLGSLAFAIESPPSIVAQAPV